MDGTKSIPRMRTAAKIVAEIRALDPDTEVTEFHIRKLAKSGAVPVVWAGRKALINLDDVLDLMRLGTARPTEEAAPAVGVIRLCFALCFCCLSCRGCGAEPTYPLFIRGIVNTICSCS